MTGVLKKINAVKSFYYEISACVREYGGMREWLENRCKC